MRLLFLAVLLFAALTSALGTAGASAQDATPVALPITPDPAHCRVAPRSPEEVLALVSGTPVAATSPAAVLSAVASEADLPAGTAADPATAAAIAATAYELIACNNAGDYPRVFAFYTDALIRGVFAGDPALVERLAADLARPPAPLPAAERAELLDVRGVRVLADGRVGAVVEDRNPQRTAAFFAILVRAGDRWLLDGQIDVQAAAPPPAGTRAA